MNSRLDFLILMRDYLECCLFSLSWFQCRDEEIDLYELELREIGREIDILAGPEGKLL
jgi:hypothetical protein